MGDQMGIPGIDNFLFLLFMSHFATKSFFFFLKLIIFFRSFNFSFAKMCSFARHIILKHSPSMSISTNKLARDFKHSAASTPCPAGSKLISSFQTHFRFLPKRLSMKKPKIWADFFPREWRPCWIFIHCDVIEEAWGRALQTGGHMSRASGCLAYYYID